MGMGVITVATCQFPVSADIRANLVYVKRQMRLAKQRGAHVVHFPEGALSGYAGTDFEDFTDFDWNALRQAASEVLGYARRARLWVVLGSAHRLSDGHKPHNSLYIIDDSGQVVDRYDKMFCSGGTDGKSGDLAHYSPGGHFSTWTVNGVRCGALICYDYRFPELYRGYKKQGVELIFHSFHAARMSDERLAGIEKEIGPDLAQVNKAATFTHPGITMPAAMTAEAAFNHVWISCPNSSAPQSCWPAFFVRADGITAGRLRRNRPGILVTTVDTSQDLYDSTAAWRYRAMAGIFHSGSLVSDARSENRTSL
jgi:predicted amidohydrolase